MKKREVIMEILAPCGDGESFFAAINNGADAIYLGLGDFNARAKSTFFNTENIREYIKIAHIFGVKVYITTNTLLKDNEIPAFMEFARKCVSARADAFIVQDLAVARLLRDAFDNVEIHASTQMGINNVAGAIMAKNLGFSRIVLARETKLEDIIAIKKATNLEIEYFVQGALCVSYSGNCYFSQYEFGKSGNRGECMQLCRLPYSAYIDNKKIGEGYLLSPRDLSLIENLRTLQDAGVDSLKIEGRLRRAGYVAQSVVSYRKAVDALKNNQKIDINNEKTALKKVFSRGEFNTRAYLDAGVPDNIINPKIQNHLGVEIGTVQNIERFKDLYRVKIKTNTEIHSGDGLKFLDENNKEYASLGVGNTEKIGENLYYIFTKNNLKIGSKIYRTVDAENENKLLKNTRKINIYANVFAHIDKPFEIEYFIYKNGDKFPAKINTNYICPKAQNSPTSAEEIKTQISKLNDTYFELIESKIDAENIFIPKSILNQARRDCIALLQEKLLNLHENNIKSAENTQKYGTMQSFLNTMHTNTSSIDNNIFVINEATDLNKTNIQKNDILALMPEKYICENIIKIFETLSKKYNHLALVLPVIANEKDFEILTKIINNLNENITLIINNISGLIFANKKHKIIAGTGLNVHNNLAANELYKLGVNNIIFSKEIENRNNNFYHFTYGHTALMHFAHCPFKTLFNNKCLDCKFSNNLIITAQNGHKFFIKRTNISQCYFTMYADKLIDKRKNEFGNLIDLRFKEKI